ncbi:ferredoxin [Candidatus Woesearchaeota archaeon]|nr:ferredoxin [Candidatus Woesearchaeota archaeon]
MVKYKIILDREACIGAYSCVAVGEEIWQFDVENNKADLKLPAANKNEKFQEVIIDEELLPKALESAGVCPVAAIKVIKLDTGENLVK